MSDPKTPAHNPGDSQPPAYPDVKLPAGTEKPGHDPSIVQPDPQPIGSGN